MNTARAVRLCLCVILVMAVSGCGILRIGQPKETEPPAPTATVARTTPPPLDTEPAPAGDGEFAMPEPFTQYENGVTITVHPKVELLAILQYTSDYMKENYAAWLLPVQTEYSRGVTEYFSDFTHNKAFDYYAKAIDIVFYSDVAVRLLLCTDDGLNMSDEDFDKFQEGVVWKVDAATRQMMDAFLADMRLLAIESDFAGFYARRLSEYNDYMTTLMDCLPPDDVRQIAEEFCGVALDNVTIVLAPLYDAAFASVLFETRRPGYVDEMPARDVYIMYSTYSLTRDDEGYDPVEKSAEHLMRGILNALFDGRSILESSTDMGQKARECQAVFDDMINADYAITSLSLARNAFADGVRTVAEIRLLNKVSIGDPAESLAALCEEKGFIYAYDVFDMFDYYEQNRDVYPTLESFYPYILDRLMSGLAG